MERLILRPINSDLLNATEREAGINEKAGYPANIWEAYVPEELGGTPPLGYRRSIAAVNDGGRWVFTQFGETFPFEKLQAYSAKRKKSLNSRPISS